MTNTLTIHIDLDNAAMVDDLAYELRVAAVKVADGLAYGYRDGGIVDQNGNTVGTWTVRADR